MKIQPFKLERYFARNEFSAPYLLCCSDCEPLMLNELLQLADDETLSLWHNLRLAYTESQGHPLLRKQIAGLYDTVSPDQVLVLNPEEGIFIFMHNILKEGDHVITTFPGYQSLYEIARSLGCETSRWIPELQDDWVFNLKDLIGMIQKNTRLIVINFPHNPTGTTISETELREIIDLARQNNICIFSDEMYRMSEYEISTRLPSASDLYENAISLSGMSKSFGLAGLRLGWLIIKNQGLYSDLNSYKDYTTICQSAPTEILAIIALKARDNILARNLGIIRKNLKMLDDFFARNNDKFRWPRPKAGTVAFPELKGRHNIEDFCNNLLSKQGVLLLPSGVYDFEGNHFRIGFGRKNLGEALNKFADYVKSEL